MWLELSIGLRVSPAKPAIWLRSPWSVGTGLPPKPWREALPLSEAVYRQESIALDSYRLAHALVRQSKAAEALPYARRAVEIFTRLGSPDLAKAQATLAECEQALAK